MNAREITWHLVKRNSYFDFRSNFACISNLSWGFLYWEADLFVINKNGYCTEVEIKLSKADWLGDRNKKKFQLKSYKSIQTSWSFIKYFYYAAPIELAKQYEQFNVKKRFGVLGIHPDGRVELVKPALQRKTFVKLTPENMLYLARLASMRAWKSYEHEFGKRRKKK